MLRKLGKLLLVGILLLALVTTDSLAPSFAKATEGKRPQRPRHPQRPQKPQHPQRVRCRPQLPELPDNYRGRRPLHVNLADPCQATDNTLAALQSADTFDADLLSSSLTQTFSNEGIKQAIQAGLEQFGQLDKIKRDSEIKILADGEWMTTEVEIEPEDGDKLRYLVVFHRENGEWKLFGTRPL